MGRAHEYMHVKFEVAISNKFQEKHNMFSRDGNNIETKNISFLRRRPYNYNTHYRFTVLWLARLFLRASRIGCSHVEKN